MTSIASGIDIAYFNPVASHWMRGAAERGYGRVSYLSLREYGVIGNQASAILISRMGSIDWCCLPFIDSPSVFSALLDENHGGSFSIAPVADFHSEQSYVGNSNVLETRFETPEGRGVLTDWMPLNENGISEPVLHRLVEVHEGEITWSMSCNPRFGYAAEGAQTETHRGGILFRGGQPGDLGLLRSSVEIRIGADCRSACGEFTLKAGQKAHFTWIWGRHGVRIEEFVPADRTIRQWENWAHDCGAKGGVAGCLFAGPWHEMVVRSGNLLKLMTANFSGAIAESITTSLPALMGGSRNWDYRYTWLRDCPLAIQALTSLGYEQEADSLFNWISDIVMRDGAEGLQSVYTLDGGRFLPERELGLSGYGGSRPVRVGNLAARQFHLDIYGHVMLACAQHFEKYGRIPAELWNSLIDIAEYVCQAWRRPDKGPWEVRSKPEHFVSSKVLCWVALDRAIGIAEGIGHEVPKRWREERDILHRTICAQGYDESRRSFIRSFGDREIDASALLIPLMGFLPPDDPRVQSTLDAVQEELCDGVLVYRYRGADGSPESDGGHLICSFWFVSCLAISGRVDEATDRLAELCSYATPLGLFGEQADPYSGNPAGNFPSASAHLALINASLYVGVARGRVSPLDSIIGLPQKQDKRQSGRIAS